MVKVKLCGFTNQETIKLAIENKVDFIGFVFYCPSPRNILPQKAGEIASQIPNHIKKIAVIVDANNQEIAEIIKYLKPDFLQLHGNETSERILEIKNLFKTPIIKAIAIANNDDLKQITDYENSADLLLLDAKSNQKGGSGKKFDWQILKNLEIKKDWFLSGGINIDNIDEALEISNARMVDLSSGIEEKKGVKSPKLIAEFMQKIKGKKY